MQTLYTENFYELIARLDLQETEEQQVAIFLSGLKHQIQDSLTLYPIWSLPEAQNRALVMEKQLPRIALQNQTSRNSSWLWFQTSAANLDNQRQ